MKVDFAQAGFILAQWAEYIWGNYPTFVACFLWFSYVVIMTMLLNKNKKGAEK